MGSVKEAIQEARDRGARPVGAVRFGGNLYTVESFGDDHCAYDGQSTAPYETLFLVYPGRNKRIAVHKDHFAQMLPYAKLEVIS